MADQKLTERPLLSSVAEDDCVYAVDGDTGEEKRIPKSLFKGSSSFFQMTCTDVSTNINQSTEVVIPWDIVQFDNSDFTSDGVGKITFNKQGRYLVYANLSFNSSSSRSNPGIRFKLNGTSIDGEALSGYIRQDSGHNEASNSFMRLIQVSAGDYLEVTGVQEANGGTITLRANQSTIYIEGK